MVGKTEIFRIPEFCDRQGSGTFLAKGAMKPTYL